MTRLRVRLFGYVNPDENPHAANDTGAVVQTMAGRPPPPVTPLPDRPSYRERAQALFDQRQGRRRWFGEHAKVFQEAAWDILLELFLCHEDDRIPSTTSVAYGAAVPITTALRSLKKLERGGLVTSWMDETDTRVRRIKLSPDAVAIMRQYLDDV